MSAVTVAEMAMRSEALAEAAAHGKPIAWWFSTWGRWCMTGWVFAPTAEGARDRAAEELRRAGRVGTVAICVTPDEPGLVGARFENVEVER